MSRKYAETQSFNHLALRLGAFARVVFNNKFEKIIDEKI